MKAGRTTFEKVCVDLILLFMTGAAIGWGYEVVLHLCRDGMFVNRGMLQGPWLPIYGTGCVLMVLLKKWAGNRPVRYFVSCVVASGILEYGTSWAMETIYHTRWWDYSGCFLNLNGRIFLGGLLGFGAAGCLFVYILLPRLKKLYTKIPPDLARYTAMLLGVLFLLDAALSIFCPNVGAGITRG